ncbi:MAG: ATP-binding protein, partial [Gemmatimonadetes bacterium]|nr:ATP-binding protein [Gemmatimonadota bacterium]
MSASRLISVERPSRPVAMLALWLAVYAGIVAFQTGANSSPLVADLAYMPFRMTLAYMLWRAAKASPDPYVARSWLLLAVGQLFAVAGNSTSVFSDLTGEQTTNLTYLAWSIPMSVLTVIGFARMISPREGRAVRAGDWLDAAVLVVACATIAWYFIAARVLTTEYDDPAVVLLFFIDSASNAATLLFATTAWLRAPHGLSPGAMPRIAIALFMVAAADLLFEAMLLRGTYQTGSPIDVWYAAAVVLFALGVDAQCRFRPGTPPPVDLRPLNRADAIVFGAIAASILPLVVELSTSDTVSPAFAASAVGVVALMVLMLWRQRIARQEIGLLVTTHLQLEHQLWQAQKLDAIGRLAAGVAHDFNNVLTAISSHAQLLSSGHGPEVASQAGEIEFAAARAATLVRRLLSFSHSDSVDSHPVVLGDVAISMKKMLRRLTDPDVTLTFEIADANSIVTLADGQLEQVLLNLVVNARDATGAGGAITVSTRQLTVSTSDRLRTRGIEPGAWAIVEVRDNGEGMDAATVSRIFEPFYTTKTVSGGTGLGLTTVAGIVRAAGGHILVDSVPGAGTTMTVFLPPAAEQPITEAAPAGPAAERGTILIVDDELSIRKVLSRYFSRLGYRVVEAADAAQAVAQIEQHHWRFDLVLTDVQMPGGSGLLLAKRLQARSPAVPVLFMTG